MRERHAMTRLALVFAVGVTLTLGGCGASTSASVRQDQMMRVRRNLAAEMLRRDDHAGALALINQILREHPEDVDSRVLRGVIYREKGLLAEAEADLRQAIKLRRKVAAAHSALAVVLDLQSRGPEAEKEHREAIELAPKVQAFHNNLGFNLFLRSRYREAIAAYQQAASLEPLNRRVRNNLGFAYARVGDWPRAAHEFELGGTAADAKNNLGFAYEQRGDLARAFELYLEALRADPRTRRARDNLKHVAQALGRTLPPEVATEPSVVTENDVHR
jgi:Tfp pilus assembly protein PilF